MSNKLICIILVILAFCGFSAFGVTPERVDSLSLGNCDKTVVMYESVYNEDQVGGSALFYPESTMTAYKDCEITSVNLVFGNYKGVKSAKIFFSTTLDGTPEYEQQIIPKKNSWNRFELTTPYKITGSQLYIGYIIDGVSVLPYSAANQNNDEYINNRDNKWSKRNSTYSASFYAIVRGDKLPMHNVRLKNVIMPGYILTNNELSFTGDISNLGAETVNSIEFTSYIGDKTVSRTIDNLNIASGKTVTLEIPGAIIEDEGAYDLHVGVTAINQAIDQDISDNNSRTVSLLSRNSFTKRKVLMEVFTSEKCNSCPSSHAYLIKETENDKDIVEISHHAGFVDDEYSIPECKEYEWFYSSNWMFAPAVMLDRSYFKDNYPEIYDQVSAVASPSQKTFPTFRSVAQSIPAIASVNLEVEGNDNSRKLTIKVDGKQLLPVPTSNNNRLVVWLTEDSLFTVKQSGGGSNGYYHRHTTRMCPTGSWGEEIDISSGYSKTYMVEIPEGWNMQKMDVVAFVGNYNTEDRTDCNIYNTNVVSLKNAIFGGVSLSEIGDNEIARYDGQYINILLDSATIAVYSISGESVLDVKANAGDAIDISALPQGCYIARIVNNKNSAIIKFVR